MWTLPCALSGEKGQRPGQLFLAYTVHGVPWRGISVPAGGEVSQQRQLASLPRLCPPRGLGEEQGAPPLGFSRKMAQRGLASRREWVEESRGLPPSQRLQAGGRGARSWRGALGLGSRAPRSNPGWFLGSKVLGLTGCLDSKNKGPEAGCVQQTEAKREVRVAQAGHTGRAGLAGLWLRAGFHSEGGEPSKPRCCPASLFKASCGSPLADPGWQASRHGPAASSKGPSVHGLVTWQRDFVDGLGLFSGSDVITRVLRKGGQRGGVTMAQCERAWWGAWARGAGPPATGPGKEAPEGHSPVTSCLSAREACFRLQASGTVREDFFVVLRHQGCGDLSQ